MRILIGVLVVALLGLLAYNYMQTGEVRVVPADRSADDVSLDALRAKLDVARKEFVEAKRVAGAAGTDAQARLQAARRRADEVKAQLDALLARLRAKATTGRSQVEAKVREKAAKLEAAVEAFRRELQ